MYWVWFFVIAVLFFLAFIIIMETNHEFNNDQGIPWWCWLILIIFLIFLVTSICFYYSSGCQKRDSFIY